MALTIDDIAKPDGFIRGQEFYYVRNINDGMIPLIKSGVFLKQKGKKMSKDYENATSEIEKAQQKFDHAIESLIDKEQKISKTTKEVSEKVRIATSKLSEGLLRIEKQANFNNLERYVELLERAEKSLSILADLEKNGRLEKIISAMK